MTGDKITARPDGVARGGEIVERHDDGSVTAEFYTPRKIKQRLDEGEFVPSDEWSAGDL